MELHTFSSLTEDFLAQYADCMEMADLAFVYFNPKVIEHKKLKNIDPELVKKAFGGDNVTVFTDSQLLQQQLRSLDYKQSAILFMTSGNFSGLDISAFAKELMEQNK
jgi:UDP-N-acetylmuramate: L-alanyl-gamma-D-glutamyl-meso-diaminopimelate ligase